MHESEHHHHDHGVEHGHREEIRTNLPRPERVSWGALFAGLFAVLAVSYLLYLLGGALGLSIADASDSTLIGEGLTEGVIIWMLLTALVAYFIGGATAARLSGTTDEMIGMMHGFVLWSVATVVLMLFGYVGLKGFLQTGQSLVVAAAEATGTAASAVGSAAYTAGASIDDAVGGVAQAATGFATSDSKLANTIQKELSQQAAQAIASAEAEGGPSVSAEEIRKSFNDLDRETLNQIVQQLLDNEQESAAELIASQTELTADQARDLAEGVYNSLERQLGNPDNQASLAEDLRRQLVRQSADVIAAADAEGGPQVTDDDIQKALNDLNTDQMAKAAQLLAYGKVDEAKNVLTENTDLSDAEVNELVEGVQNTYQAQIEKLSQAAEEVGETANAAVEELNDYAQAVTWSAFASAGIGLAIAILGGWCGADTSRRYYYERHTAGSA
ncbi:hypothetical protein [Botrimarina sp.]|uniref:hypothetical protein n=1 Tax=Botrimarina sp. TaxID=2795802 RepID=UPI0032EBACA1